MKFWLVGFLIALILFVAACTDDLNDRPEQTVPNADADRGQELIASYGCGSCHTIDGVPGAHTKVGPPLTGFRSRASIAGTLPNTPDNLIRWISDPQAVKPGVDMPDLGVSTDEARDIAAYLYQQSSSMRPGGPSNPPSSLDSQGPAATRIAGLWWLMLAFSVIIYALVIGLLAAALLRRRRSTSSTPPISDDRTGRNWVVWGGIIMPAVVLLIVFGYTVQTLV